MLRYYIILFLVIILILLFKKFLIEKFQGEESKCQKFDDIYIRGPIKNMGRKDIIISGNTSTLEKCRKICISPSKTLFDMGGQKQCKSFSYSPVTNKWETYKSEGIKDVISKDGYN